MNTFYLKLKKIEINAHSQDVIDLYFEQVSIYMYNMFMIKSQW